MASPADERDQPKYPIFHKSQSSTRERSSDEEGTMVGEGSYGVDDGIGLDGREPKESLHVNTMTADNGPVSDMPSPSKTREQAHRLDDDLRMLQIERQVSQAAEEQETRDGRDQSTVRRERSRREEVVDDFDVATNPLHERAQVYKPPEHPENGFAKFMKKIHKSSFLVRYFTYIVPVVLIILIPLLIGAFVSPVASKDPNVGGVKLVWFCIWLEIVWLTLWAGRILAKLLPWPMGLISSLFTNNSKKWRDMGKQLEVPATLFFWMLAVEVSFLPTMRHHSVDGRVDASQWQKDMNKVLVSFFILAILNFIEKIIIQLIAISFHLRTYSDRIELNKFQTGSLTKLYSHSKAKIAMEDSDFEAPSGGGPGSGARTPGQYIEKAQKGTVEAFNKFGDVAGKIAGDFTGRDVKQSGHPSQVVLSLLSTTGGSQVLARRLYRTFGREETHTVFQEDLTDAFENQDEADAAFSMFDKDMNGDISMEELEAVCVEIGRERKSITASLKDLDSVVSKLDDVLFFLVVVISVLVLISLVSTSASGVLTSAGSAVLALSWLFSTTAQEFLQSIVFVFVKHPFDVGDRVTIYGNTGTTLTGDDYFVKEIALLYTEFKKMEGQVVQAPNSYLNTLFILNQRRSGGLAEAVPMIFKFGTSLEQIEGLRSKLLDFVKAEKREYQSNILTELREITEAHSITLNIVFFFKSNWQNELLRLQRRNKFICALMVCMQELGIEGPRMRYPGMREHFPVYTQSMPYNAQMAGRGGNPDHPEGQPPSDDKSSFLSSDRPSEMRSPSMTRTRQRGESLAQMGRRMDFSLGMSSVSSGDLMGDVHEDRENEAARNRIPISVTAPSRQSTSRTSHEQNGSVGRSTSRSHTFGPGGLRHRLTEPAESSLPHHSNSIHRNRFLGRKSQETDRMESGMAGIPEHGISSDDRLDGRTGLISLKAMRTTTTNETQQTTRFPSYGDKDAGQAQGFELQQLHAPRTASAFDGPSNSRAGLSDAAAPPPVSIMNYDPYAPVQPTADVAKGTTPTK